MFTWICPNCGREVPPSYSDCPDCAAKTNAPPPQAEPTPAVQPLPPPPPQYQPPPQQYQAPPQQYQQPQQQYQPPQQQQYQPPPQQYQQPPQQYPPQQQYQPPQQQQYQPPPPPFYSPPPARRPLPTWLMSILSALVFGAIVLAAYYFLGSSRKDTNAATPDSGMTLENPPAAASAAAAKNPLTKQIEITGLRLSQSAAKKTEVRFLIVNHSGADIPDFSATVRLQARTRKKDEESVGSFKFKSGGIGPYESKELFETLATKLKVYELPDWQNLQTEISFAP